MTGSWIKKQTNQAKTLGHTQRGTRHMYQNTFNIIMYNANNNKYDGITGVTSQNNII